MIHIPVSVQVRGCGLRRTLCHNLFMCLAVMVVMLSGMLPAGTPAQAATSAQLKAVNAGFLTSLPAPAGNDASSTVSYPARFDGVLAALRSYRPDLSASEAESLLLVSAATTDAGRVVDVETLFRTAGLGSLVDQYRSTEEETNSNGAVNSSFNTDAGFEVVELNKPRVKSRKMRGRKVTLKLASTPMPGSTLHIKASGINKKINAEKIKNKTITLSLKRKPKKTLKLRLRFTHPEFYATDWVTVSVKIKARR